MLKRKKKVIAKVMATTMLATTIATTFGIEAKADSISPRTAVSSSRISGSDRYKTAVEISKNYSSSSKHAVIVNGQKGIVDALTATPYASLKNAPILMTQNNKLNADTKAELTRRGIKTVDIVGGVNSVNDSVKSEIQAMGITVNRIAGSSKYDTALEVAKKIDAISDISKIAVANGEVLADAVSVAAPAAQNEMPIILAHPKNGLDDKTKSYIDNQGVKTSYVIGGTNSVSSTTQNSLPGTKKRLEGSGRQDTNAAVVKEFYTSSSYDNVYVTKSGQVNTQDEIADALAVGVLAAKEQDPVMIVGKSLATSQSNLLKDKKFTQMTEIGNGIPSASINSIKDTQKSPEELEATVSSVSLVNYNTIKIVGKELNRIDGNKVEINDNSVSSYTVNEAGTEAKVVFNKTFNSGTNTVKVTSNSGKITTHTFTYSTEISGVEAVTSEIGLDGIQYLEFTVNNGQKRTVKELENLGWSVEFSSNKKVFYKYDKDNTAAPLYSSNTSTTGQLKTDSKFDKDDTFYYEVTLKKDGRTYKTDKKYVNCKDKSKDVKEIRDCKLMFTNDISNTEDDAKEYYEMKSKTLLIGETLNIPTIEVTNLNGSKNDELDSGYTIQSSNPRVLKVSQENGKYLNAINSGTSTITIKVGDVTKTYSITVNEVTDSNKRKPNTYKFENTSIKMLSEKTDGSKNSETVKVTITDKYGDPVPADSLDSKINWTKEIKSSSKDVATVKLDPLNKNKKGEFLMTITSSLDTSLKSASGTVKLQYDGKDMSGSSLSVYVSRNENVDDKLTYKLKETSSGDDVDLDLDRYAKQGDNTLELKLESYTSGGYFKENIQLDKDKFKEEKEDYYIVETSDEDILPKDNINVNDSGNLEFTLDDDGDTGSVTITLYQYKLDGSNLKKTKRADIRVKIEDTTPRLKELRFNEIKDITSFTKDKDDDEKYTTDFEIEDLFEIDKMKGSANIRNIIQDKYIDLKGTQVNNIKDVSIDFKDGNDYPVIFIDSNENGIYEKEDDLLATIVMECSEDIKTKKDTIDTKNNTNAYQIKLDENEDQDGHIVIRVYDGKYEKTKKPFKDLSIRIKVDKVVKPIVK